VLEERLRIARELHDVVAHHVSLIGIQAAAGRRVMAHDSAAAERALGQIEVSSREAVSQMRGLLGTLRTPGGREATADRSPEPGLADLPALIRGHAAPGFSPSFELVESPAGAAQVVPGPVGLTLFRTVQEALANVGRHSTASRAGVVLRITSGPDGGHAEVEVVDDGRPRTGTSGSGLGQLGIRERVASLRGEVEIGPRATGGYRVRVRLPLGPVAVPAPGEPREGAR
jgi:signal transduction histidine kinase